VSDHDVWHARWLETLVSVLDREPPVVIAYSASLRTTADDAWLEKKGFDTTGIERPAARIARAAQTMLSGDMIYGLMRASALQAAGIFHHVVTPDRQVLLALSLFGDVRHVPEVLWYREMVRDFDLERQRKVFFPDGTPLYAYLPSHLQHCASLLWDFGVRGNGRPYFGRFAGASYAAVQLWFSMARQLAAAAQRSAPRMKILFVMRHSGYVRNFESTLRMLCDRGHNVELAFQIGGTHWLLDPTDVASQLTETYPRFSRSVIPVRDDAWGYAAREVRVALGLPALPRSRIP
jgi:hypothetical protein